MAVEEVDIADFCRKLVASGVTRSDALKAVADLWPSSEPSRKRLLRLSDGEVLVVEDEVALKDESSYFNTLFSGPFKEGQEPLVDLSQIPSACRATKCVRHFVRLAESHGSLDLRAELGTDHIKELVPLMNLCNYFSAEHLEETCMAYIMNHWRELLGSSCQSVVQEIPWPHFERLLASVQSEMDVVKLAGLWCFTTDADDDPLTGFLKRRCGDLARFSLDDMLAICSSHLHLLAKLPRDATIVFFHRLRREMQEIRAEIGQVMQSAFPALDARHTGQYRAGYNPGWTCCGATLKKSEGCYLSVRQSSPPSESHLATRLGLMKDVLFDKTNLAGSLDAVFEVHSNMLDEAIQSDMRELEDCREQIQELEKELRNARRA